MKAVDTKASRCRLNMIQQHKAGQGREKKNCFSLWHFCQAGDKISTSSDGEVCMELLEQNCSLNTNLLLTFNCH